MTELEQFLHYLLRAREKQSDLVKQAKCDEQIAEVTAEIVRQGRQGLTQSTKCVIRPKLRAVVGISRSCVDCRVGVSMPFNNQPTVCRCTTCYLKTLSAGVTCKNP